MPRLLNNLSRVVHVVVVLEVLNDLHSPVAPLLSLPHELLEHPPLRNTPREVHFAYGENDLVPSLFGPQVLHLVPPLANIVDHLLTLGVCEIKVIVLADYLLRGVH